MQGGESVRQQLQAAVLEAVSATQEHMRSVLEARDAAIAAAEADVQELRSALAGRDERLLQLEQQLEAAAAGAASLAAAKAAAEPGVAGGAEGQTVAQRLGAEVDSLRRELAAAHQRTHEVTQMYLAAAAGGAGAGSADTTGGAAAAGLEAQGEGGIAVFAGSGFGGVGGSIVRRVGWGVGAHPKGLVGLYKRPQVRGMFVLYFVAVHAAVSAIVMQAS